MGDFPGLEADFPALAFGAGAFGDRGSSEVPIGIKQYIIMDSVNPTTLPKAKMTMKTSGFASKTFWIEIS